MKKIKKILTVTTTLPLIGGLTPMVASCSCNKDTYPYKNILITDKPTKVSYLVGEQLNLSGLVVTGILSNFGTEVLSSDKYTTSIAEGTTLTQTGKINIEIKTVEGNLSSNFTIYVSEKKITSFTIKQQADKVIYNSGETLDLTGMVVEGTYSDGSTKILTKDEYTTFPLEGNKVYPQENLVKNFYVYDPNDISNYAKSWIVVTSAAKSFEDASWHEIVKWIDYLYVNPDNIPDFENLFCTHFNKQYIENFIGCQHDLVLDGRNYKVTIVDVRHDELETPIISSEGTITKALFTFRFDNAIGNASGTAVTQKWGDNNKSYINSSIKPVVSALADKFEEDAKAGLRSVKKTTRGYNGSSWEDQTYNDKVFIPTTTEMGTSTDTGGTKYDYLDTNAKRKVTNLSGNETHYWTSTPNEAHSEFKWIWYIGSDGIAYKQFECTNTEPFAPFFCM